ncbi:SDR family NAD(P)-dependent oxidoreductase [Candidatus Dactylopiibacterium carminicum]|uniref:SDR family NAD(P)-dependent oxidoreductase n=1 Tax=Candidatus Dactylopiibacterium carminicum TaxID=857335 RepID=UPI001CC2E466|nr:SDR family NAD(P)-dependent oxidoreductase [Candidatus Dactylopiibacterium carminicum]
MIWITGASGSIGAALAEAYAGVGVHLVLQGRDEARLSDLMDRCKARGAEVSLWLVDLCDLVAMRRWLAEADTPDLLIANAGRNTHVGPNGEPEPWSKVEALLDVNLRAVMALVHGVLPGMRKRGSGQIALVSSLAGYFGLPMTPAYSASKAAVKAYGEALRGWLAPEGVRVSVIMPGYVASPMCHAMPGPKPFLWPPERAAQVILRGLARNRARIVFPRLLAWGCWWLAVLPPALSCRILRWLDYRA